MTRLFVIETGVEYALINNQIVAFEIDRGYHFVQSDGLKLNEEYTNEEITAASLSLLELPDIDRDVDTDKLCMTRDESGKWVPDDNLLWHRDMAEFDKTMPRYLEDHIRDHHSGQVGNAYGQQKYDEKVAKRAAKP